MRMLIFDEFVLQYECFNTIISFLEYLIMDSY